MSDNIGIKGEQKKIEWTECNRNTLKNMYWRLYEDIKEKFGFIIKETRRKGTVFSGINLL